MMAAFWLTSGGFRAYPDSIDTDAYDVAAFDFTEPVADHPELRRRFFDLSQVPPNTFNNDVIAVLLAGYPAKEQSYDLEENNHLGLAPNERCACFTGAAI